MASRSLQSSAQKTTINSGGVGTREVFQNASSWARTPSAAPTAAVDEERVGLVNANEDILEDGAELADDLTPAADEREGGSVVVDTSASSLESPVASADARRAAASRAVGGRRDASLRPPVRVTARSVSVAPSSRAPAALLSPALRPRANFLANKAELAWEALGSTVFGLELQALLPMAAPVMASSCLSQLLNIVDLFFIGNFLGPVFLAAAALGNSWFVRRTKVYQRHPRAAPSTNTPRAPHASAEHSLCVFPRRLLRHRRAVQRRDGEE
jgi:hypothetical protein